MKEQEEQHRRELRERQHRHLEAEYYREMAEADPEFHINDYTNYDSTDGSGSDEDNSNT